MRTRSAILAVLLATTLLTPRASWAEDPAGEEPKLRLKLEVLGDQNIDTEAAAFLKKEIGALSHIALVDEDAQVYMHVIARRIVTNTGRNMGYVMASASAEILEIGLKDGTPFTCSDYSGLWLETGPDLRSLCEKCIMAVDFGVFNKVRKALKDQAPEMTNDTGK